MEKDEPISRPYVAMSAERFARADERVRQFPASRTQLQKEADQLDLQLFRCLQEVEAFTPKVKKAGGREDNMRTGAFYLKRVRDTVRLLMHPIDRERTEG